MVIGAAVATAYVIAARFGFQFGFIAEQVTTVWPPTGIAQAALLLWGPSLWPAIWIGAFAANATTTMPLWAAAGVATGNALEAILAVLLSRGGLSIGLAGILMRGAGLGIDPDDRKHIFEPFYRGREAVSRQIKGSGLGLNLVQRIAEAHGGRVAVTSEPGKGSTFTIMLPGVPDTPVTDTGAALSLAR